MPQDPTIDIFRDLIQPLGDRLKRSPRFVGLKIFYDTDEVAFAEMPAIEYYVESPWEDRARGSGSYTLQTRVMIVKIAFSIYVYHSSSRAEMDQNMFRIGGMLIDFLRDETEFDRARGIWLTRTPILWEVVRPETQTGFTGIHRIISEFECVSGTGR